MSSAFEQLAEQRIDEAMRNGYFDDLPNKGKPLDLEAHFATPSHLRVSHGMLKSAGFIPPEVELMRQIDKLEQEALTEDNPRALKKLELLISNKKSELAMAMDRIRHQSRQSLGGQAW